MAARHEQAEQSNSLPLETNRLKLLGKTALATLGVTAGLLIGGGYSQEAKASPGEKVDLSNQAAWVSPAEEIGPAVRNEPLQVGITAYNSYHDDPDDPESLLAEMAELGMTGARMSVSRGAGGDLETMRKEIAAAHEKGIEIVVNLGQAKSQPLEGFPKWAAETAEQLPNVERFVILNEVNSPLFSEDTLEDNVDVLFRSNKLIKEVRPNAIVSGLGLATQYDPIGYLKKADAYAREKYGGLVNVMDTLSIHTYRKPWGSYKLIKEAEEIWSGLINIDEAGLGVRGQGHINDPEGTVTPRQQAKLMWRFLKLMAMDPQVQNVFNYRMDNSGDPSDLKTGFKTDAGDELPAYYVLEDRINSGALEKVAEK